MRIPQGKIAKEFKGEEQQDALKENAHGIYYDISVAIIASDACSLQLLFTVILYLEFKDNNFYYYIHIN